MIRSLTLLLLLLTSASPALGQTLFPNSVVSNDLEFIKPSDPSTFSHLDFIGRDRAEMPDKRGGGLFANGVYKFLARYKDGSKYQIWAHPDFGSQRVAELQVAKVARAMGQLPYFMRRKLRHIVLHQGDETAFAESDGGFFVVYSRNVARRILTDDLPHTLFHESVHAVMDRRVLSDPKWRAAQRADGAFLTEYAQRRPSKEDLAETALFAWALYKYPGRLPREIETQVRELIPNRLEYLNGYFDQQQK